MKKLLGYTLIISIMVPCWLVGFLFAAAVSGFRRGQQDFEETI